MRIAVMGTGGTGGYFGGLLARAGEEVTGSNSQKRSRNKIRFGR
jgi:ketopantoate reductase